MLPMLKRLPISLLARLPVRLSGTCLLCRIILVALLTCSMAEANDSEGFQPPANVSANMMWSFILAENAVNENLSRIESELSNASHDLGESGIEGKASEQVLEKLLRMDPSQIDIITVGCNGTVMEVMPDSYQSIKGANIGDQGQIKELFASKVGAGYDFIKTIEGSGALNIAEPVFDEQGQLVGAVSLLINASDLFHRTLAPFQPSTGNAKLWIMQAENGRVLYDTDASQIGLTLSDPVYRSFPQLLELGRRVSRERTGFGSYEFFDQDHRKTIKKGVYWTTLANPGVEIRLLLTVELD